MRTVAQGGTLNFRAQFRLDTGELVDPDEVIVDVLDPASTLSLADQPTVRVSQGVYSYGLVVPVAADLGTWTIDWQATAGALALTAQETFEVVLPSSADTTAAIVRRIRRLLGERIPIGKDENATRFLDDEIQEVYYTNGEDINKSLAELWLAKAAYLGDFVDINESGTQRSLSQMQKAAMSQANTWANRASVYDQAWAATYRTTARTFSPYDDPSNKDRIRAGAVIVVVEDAQRLWSGTGI